MSYAVLSSAESVRIEVGGAKSFAFPATSPKAYAWLRDRCASGLHEPVMSDLVIAYLQDRPNATFLDIGSLFGYFSLLAMAASSGTARVFAFEMNAKNFSVLQETLAANEHLTSGLLGGSVTAVHAAVGRVDAARQSTTIKGFVLGSTNPAARQVTIDFVSVDNFASQHGLSIDLVKIDVEGYEGEVVSGAASTFLRDRTVVLVELHGNTLLGRTGITRLDFLQNMLRLGFRVYHLGGDREARPDRASELTSEHLAQRGYKPAFAGTSLIVLSSQDIRTYWPNMTVGCSW